MNGVDSIKYPAVSDRPHQRDVLGVYPGEGDGGRRGEAEPQEFLGDGRLIPELFREQANADRESLQCLQQRKGIMPGGEFVVCALTREERPRSADTPSSIRRSVGPLTVSIVVVPIPTWPRRHVDLQHGIDHLQRIDDYRIMRIPNSVPNELEEACIDDLLDGI